MKIATYNVNGIRARMAALLQWLEENRPDILCIQETKVQDKDFPAADIEAAGWRVAFHGQKSYNGVAIISRDAPENVRINFNEPDPEEARFISADFSGVTVINTYVPQGRDPESEHFIHKLNFYGRVKAYLAANFTPDTPLLWVGDLNVAPLPLDVHDPKKLYGHVCYHPEEHAALAEITAWGLTDVWREKHPDVREYTFYDYRVRGGVSRGIGWRIDHILATGPLAEKCTDAYIDLEPRKKEKPSDHTFLVAAFDV